MIKVWFCLALGYVFSFYQYQWWVINHFPPRGPTLVTFLNKKYTRCWLFCFRCQESILFWNWAFSLLIKCGVNQGNIPVLSAIMSPALFAYCQWWMIVASNVKNTCKIGHDQPKLKKYITLLSSHWLSYSHKNNELGLGMITFSPNSFFGQLIFDF